MNPLIDKVLAWLGTRHTEACDERAKATKAQGYTATCACDFGQRAAADFDRKTAEAQNDIEWAKVKANGLGYLEGLRAGVELTIGPKKTDARD